MDFLIDWIENTGGLWVYLAVMVSAFGENMFTPLPGDSVTVFGAYLAGLGKVNAVGVYIASTIGGTAGFMGLYVIGKSIQRRGERRGKLLFIKIDGVNKIEERFNKWGYWVILFNRFLYGIRFAVALFAGMSKLDWRRTTIFALLSTAAWNLVLVYLGVLLGENWGAFKEIMWRYSRVFLLAAVLGVMVYAGIRMIPRTKRIKS
ncbi:MAG: DedA family protein [candidate division Zixibacteria bacterium]|nr:DedA family protein [Candidatus Tariuqbacter arcticus]